MRTSLPRRLLATVVAAGLLASCGGGDPETAASSQNGDRRQKALGIVPPTTPIPPDAHLKGLFGAVQAWPLIAVHGVLTSDGRVLSYGSRGDGLQTGNFIYDVWNPADGSHLTLANGTGTDIFCSSQIMLPSGAAVVLNGGDNWTGSATTNGPNNNSNVFDVATRSLTRANNMNRARWYSSSTMLLNGEIYIQGGSGGTDLPEIRATNGTYRLLSGAGTGGFDFMYPRNFIAPDGRVFGFDSAGRMYYVNTSGNGAVTTAGQFASATAGSDSSAAMFAPGRILQYGGQSNQAIVIDINGATPSITTTSALLRQRRLSVATILADGKVLATGGSSVWNQPTNVSLEAEIWNPQTGQWLVGASAVKPRLYHGNALLLPDATVLVFGGGADSPINLNGNLNAEIYYPPYLFSAGAEAARPVIDSAPTVVDVGRTVQVAVTSGRPVSRVSFVKTGSATHGFNMDQRFVDLPFNAQGGTLSVQIPGRASDVPPGIWMMFVFDDAGVPSVAKQVRVNVAGALNTAVVPTLTSPGDQSTVIGNAVNLPLAANDPNGDVLTYSASGLPAGLSIDTSTGLISGAASALGSYSVVLAVSDGINSASRSITWNVTGVAPLVLDPPQPAAPTAAGSAASFSATASGINVLYRWDFGDGTPVTAASPTASVTHAFANPGVYYVTAIASDDRGVEQRRTFIHNVHLTLTAARPEMSSTLAFEPRSGANPRLWVVNPDNDSVSVFDAVTRAKLAEVTVGTAPRTLALAPDGSVWVANKRSATISVISAATLAVSRTIALARASQPYGIAFARAGNAALVALEASGVLLKIDATSGATLASLAVGANPRHVAIAADGASAFVSRFITPPLPGEATASVATTLNGTAVGGEIVVIDIAAMSAQRTIVLAHSNQPDGENQGRGFPNYLGAMAISPDGTQAYVPSKQDNLQRGVLRDGSGLNFQNTVRAISSRIVMGTQAEDLASRIDHDNASLASAAAFDPLGVYLFVALETSREVAVLDAHNRNQLMRIDVGRAPQGLLVAPDRKTLYVMNFMDRSVGAFDLTPLLQQGLASVTPLATLAAVGSEKLSATVLKGKQFFYDARDTRLARDRYMSCAACHNDGGQDGRVWDLSGFGEGLRNTIGLRGRGGMGQGFLHWSNNFDEVQDFEGQIRALAGGTGLMSDTDFNAGTRSQPLGDTKAGRSADLDALAAYLGSLNSFEPSPHRPSASTLSSDASAGRTLFQSMNCAACHSGAAFSASGNSNPQNIGTIKASSGQRLGAALTGIDVPTLRDVWATAPYLHDGSAATVEAAVRAHSGVTIGDANLAQLGAYLREIGADESTAPSPVGSGTGLTGQYFNNVALSGSPVLTRSEAVNFSWGSGSPGGGVSSNNFSARWTGTAYAATSGSYRFQTSSDDGVRVWVNGVQVINNWTDHAAATNTSASIALTAGQFVTVRVEYYEKGGQAVMRLRWLTPGTTSYVAIPRASLFPQ